MDEKTKSELIYVIGYLEGIAEFGTADDSVFDSLQKPIVILKQIIGLDEIKEPTK